MFLLCYRAQGIARGQRGVEEGRPKGNRQCRLHPFSLSQGTAAVSAKEEICKWQAGFALFPEQLQWSQNKCHKKHEALKHPPPPPHSHIYTHHNSCYIKAVITTASWLSISVYLWCITHFNAILIQQLSCHSSVFGWGEKKKKTHIKNGCNIQYAVPWEQKTN